MEPQTLCRINFCHNHPAGGPGVSSAKWFCIAGVDHQMTSINHAAILYSSGRLWLLQGLEKIINITSLSRLKYLLNK